MFAAISPSEAADAPRLRAVTLPQRTRGEGRVSFRRSDGGTRLDRLYQDGAARIRLPHAAGPQIEAILINTAGGLTGGDDMAWHIEAGDGASATIATQACEKIYRASASTARIETRLAVGSGARLDWLPQETILFERAALARSLDADLAADARLLACEAIVFGRQAMGETMTSGALRDRWRVRRAGRLIFADDLRFEGAVADILARPATLSGARVLATLLYCGEDAEALAEPARAALGETGGLSAFEDKLVARLVAPDALALRRALLPLLASLRGGRPLPRVWTI